MCVSISLQVLQLSWPCYSTLCYVMLCYVMLCYVMLCYVMFCYVMLHHFQSGEGIKLGSGQGSHWLALRKWHKRWNFAFSNQPFIFHGQWGQFVGRFVGQFVAEGLHCGSWKPLIVLIFQEFTALETTQFQELKLLVMWSVSMNEKNLFHMEVIFRYFVRLTLCVHCTLFTLPQNDFWITPKPQICS